MAEAGRGSVAGTTPSAEAPRPRRTALTLLVSLLALTLAACAAWVVNPFDTRFGPSDPTRHDERRAPTGGLSYARDIQPILDRRCVVCHACYDAPCQLKATAWEGLARGANPTPVYDATRLLAAEPTRLFEDADRASAWRRRGFHPVLSEHADASPAAQREAGLIHRLLSLKAAHPLPDSGTVPEALGLGLDRPASCPAESDIDAHERRQPLAGMPFALPGLPDAEQRQLLTWLEAGAPAEPVAPLPPRVRREVDRWERFFNGDDAKTRLFARYAYEHLALAHLHFGGDMQQHLLRMVRSSTPPGQPVQRIVTRRPVDDPGVERVYYRLVREEESIVAKTHMPYLLDEARMARWRAWFLDAPFKVGELPGYGSQEVANPFVTYAALPVSARYRFMLDEAAFTIMGFIKGPVCRGQMAVNVIEDRFWVSFITPSASYDQALTNLLQRDVDMMRLPSGSANTDIVGAWLHFGLLEASYLSARTTALERFVSPERPIDLSFIWDGDGRNDNAGLTVFRHFDSASVVKGFVGEPPKSAWVIGYPLLERIHYLLAADYDVYGNIGHQLNSRLYMDYLRAEGEFNFLVLLPRDARVPTRDLWYRGAGQRARQQVYGGPGTTLDADSGIRFRTDDPRRELMVKLRDRLAPVLSTTLDWRRDTPRAWQSALGELAALQGASLQWLPEFAVLVVSAADGRTQQYSLMRDTGHASVSNLLDEKVELLPDENALTLTRGIVGAYPNVYYRVDEASLPAFVQSIRGLRSEADYGVLAARWSVRRTDPGFWAFSDAVMSRYRHEQARDAGILDYNRYENR